MSLTEIIFRLFAWVRPLLWYSHRAGNLIAAFLLTLEREAMVESLIADPRHRQQWEGMIADCEHLLDIAIGLRACELLGRPIAPETRPGIRQKPIRIPTPPSFQALMLRLMRLVARYYDLERLARLRAARIRREMETAPVRLEVDHRPGNPPPSLSSSRSSSPRRLAVFFFFAPAVAPTPAGLPIRGPPWLIVPHPEPRRRRESKEPTADCLAATASETATPCPNRPQTLLKSG